jgi:hypothetical protein
MAPVADFIFGLLLGPLRPTRFLGKLPHEAPESLVLR